VVVALTARSLQEEHESGAQLAAQVTRLLMAFCLVLTVGLGIVVRPVIIFAFGAEFEQAAVVFGLLVPGILSWALSSQVQAFLATHGRLFPGLGLTMLLVNLALNLVLIPRFGILGAAAATSISYCGGNGYVTWVFMRTTGHRLRDLMLLRRDDWQMLRVAIGAQLSDRGAHR